MKTHSHVANATLEATPNTSYELGLWAPAWALDPARRAFAQDERAEEVLDDEG